MKLIAVQGCTLTAVPGTVTILPPPASVVSQTITIDSKPAYHTISFTVTDEETASAGAGILNGTSIYCSGDSMPFVLDKDHIEITLTNTTSGATFPCVVTVTNPGQTSTSVD